MRTKVYLIITVLLMLAISFACKKSGRSIDNCDEIWIEKKKKEFMTLSSCSPVFKHYLGKGIYNSSTIYYTSIICVNCDIAPPQYGITCEGDTIKVPNWNNVKNTKILVTCRDL